MNNVPNIIKFYQSYWLHILIATLSVIILYELVGDWGYYSSVVRCIFRGNFSSCFDVPRANNCKDLQHGKAFGWCNDSDNYGALPGNASGPIGSTCQDWIWYMKDCPPTQCSDLTGKTWGWCADPGIERAMRGKMCGPINGERCNNWVWHADNCPKSCPKPKPLAATADSANNCKTDDDTELICGNVCGLVNGQDIPCPPKCIRRKRTKGKKCQNLCGLITDDKGNKVMIKCPPPPCGKDNCICN